MPGLNATEKSCKTTTDECVRARDGDVQETIEYVCARNGLPQPVLRRAGDAKEYKDVLLRRTYAFVDEAAPATSGRETSAERTRSVVDVVHSAIDYLFKASAKPRNVLCKGMHRRIDSGSKARERTMDLPGVTVSCVTSAYEAFMSPVWETLCDRIGEELMMHILLYWSVFIRVGSANDTPLLQICGYSIIDARSRTRVANAKETNKMRMQAHRKKRAAKKRKKVEEAEAARADSNAVESKCASDDKNTSPLTKNPFISEVDLQEVVRLSQVLLSSQDIQVSTDDEQSTEIRETQSEHDADDVSHEEVEKPKEKRKHRAPSWIRKREKRKLQQVHAQTDEPPCVVLRKPRIIRMGRVVDRTPTTTRDNKVKLAAVVFDRHAFMFRASFAKKPGLPVCHVLRSSGTGVRASRRMFHEVFNPNKFAKIARERGRRSARNAKSTHKVPHKFRETLLPAFQVALERATTCPFAVLLNRHAPMPKGLMVASSRVTDISEESLLSAYTPPRSVAMFVWAVIDYIFPNELLGGEKTRRALQDFIKRVVSMRRYERCTLHEAMHHVHTGDFKCFKAAQTNMGSAGQAEASQRRMVCKWIAWLVKEMVFPLIRGHFYCTDTQTHRQRMFFYRKGVWARLVSATLQNLEQTSFKRLTTKDAAAMLERANKSNLGFSSLRFLPKGTGLRPVAVLNKPSKFIVKAKNVRKVKDFHAVNSRLKGVFEVLAYESVRDPNVMGAAVGDYQSALMRIGPCIRAIRHQRRLGRCSKAFVLATDIKGAFDNLPLSTLERVAVDLLQGTSYQTLKYTVMKQDGTSKYKTTVASLKSHEERGVPGPLVTEIHRRQNTGGVAVLKSEPRESVIVDNGMATEIFNDDIVPLLRAHLKENMVSSCGKFMLQTVGIPQGSIVSPLLCSLFYGHLEHKYKLLTDVCDTTSTVCRWMDDILLITTEETRAKTFVDTCKRGFEEHGCSLNTLKTLCNFDHEPVLTRRTFMNTDGQEFIPWCGILINVNTLEIMVDYSRYAGEFLRETMNLPLSRTAWLRLPDRICGFLKPKCAALFYDESINSPLTCRVNVFQLFLMAAMKTHSYVAAASKIPGCNPIAHVALYRAIKHAISFGQVLIQRHIARARAHCGSFGRIPNAHIEFLARIAFLSVLGRKQARYKRTIELLVSGLSSRKMKRATRNALLKQATDPSRSAIFETIRF